MLNPKWQLFLDVTLFVLIPAAGLEHSVYKT